MSLMASRVSYECTALIGSNKTGVIKPLPNGYYPLVVGGLNMYNSSNSLYLNDEHAARILVDQSSEFQRMVGRGVLRGEYGHPKRLPGMDRDAFMQRALQIYEDRVCAHFRKVWLDANLMKDGKGRPVVAIMAEVKPSGEKGHLLQQHLDNPGENVCFSIRSFTKDVRGADNVLRKSLRKVVTFDYVNEPGMDVAEKFKAPSLESYSEESFSRTGLTKLYNQLGEDIGVSMEATGVRLSLEDLFASLGWRDEAAEPSYMGW